MAPHSFQHGPPSNEPQQQRPPPPQQQQQQQQPAAPLGTDGAISSMRRELASMCEQSPELAMANRCGIEVSVLDSWSGEKKDNIDFGYVGIDETAALAVRNGRRSGGGGGAASGNPQTVRGSARLFDVPGDDSDDSSSTRFLRIKNANPVPVLMKAVEFLPDEGVYEVLLPGKVSEANADGVPLSREPSIPLKRERRGGQMLLRLPIQPQGEVVLEVRCRPPAVMRFYAAWVALHIELSRMGTVLESVAQSCVICRKAVAVAIRSSDIKALDPEARPFIPELLRTIFDTPLPVLGLADWQCADAKIPALPPPSALAEYPLPPDADYPTAFSESDKLQANSSLTASDLLMDRYRKRFARLLALEEGQMARDIAQYTLYGVTVKPLATSPDPDESPDCVIIIVKGAMEQRPALTFGDIVRIRLAASGSGEHTLPGCLLEWQGRVLNVNQDKVAVKLRKSNIGSSAKVCGVCSRKIYAIRAPCGCQICDGCVRQQLLQLCAGMPADKVRQTLGGRAAWIAAWSALHRSSYVSQANQARCKKNPQPSDQFLVGQLAADHRPEDLDKFENFFDVESRGSEELFLDQDRKVHVAFTINRLPFRHMYRALEDVGRLWHLINPDPERTAPQLRLRPDHEFDFTARAQGTLNTQQVQAIRYIASGAHGRCPMVVFGPPGTGKTLTMVEAIVQVLITDRHARILAVAPSNSAADTFAQRLVAVSKEDHLGAARLGTDSLCRVNSPQRQGGIRSVVYPDLLPFCPQEDGIFVVPDAETLSQYDVVVCTCQSAGLIHTAHSDGSLPNWPEMREKRGSGYHFTHIFMDEASQAMEPEALVPLALAGDSTAVVLAGDHQQLGASARCPLAAELELSLMERLMSLPGYQKQLQAQRSGHAPPTACAVKLLNNYRSHSDILEIPSQLFYDGELRACANPLETDSLCEWEELADAEYMDELEADEVAAEACPVMFFGVQGIEMHEADSPSWYNPVEASKIVDLIEALLNSETVDVEINDIGVIALYRQQVLKTRLMLRERGLGAVRVGGVDDYQGQEERIIFISTVVAKQRAFDSAVRP